MRHKVASLGYVLIALLAIGAGCRRPERLEIVPPPLSVLYALPSTEDLAEYVEFIGQTEGCATVDIRARVSGFLEKIHFTDGAIVREGDALFEIDNRLYLADLQRAEGVLAQANARLRRVTADFRRAQMLIKMRHISQDQYDLAAGAHLEAAAQVLVADGEKRKARLNFDFCRVTAPLSGRASRSRVDAGNLVKLDETILTNIAAIDPIEVNLDIDERTLLRVCRLVQAGEVAPFHEMRIPFQVRLADETSAWHDGTIDFFDNHLDPTTGTIRARGIVPNPDRLFSPGMFVRARVQIGRPRTVVLITERALGTKDGKKFVYVIGRDDQVLYRPVTPGRLIGERRVIKYGLSSGDRVLVSALQRVQPGMKVEAKPEMVSESS